MRNSFEIRFDPLKVNNSYCVMKLDQIDWKLNLASLYRKYGLKSHTMWG